MCARVVALRQYCDGLLSTRRPSDVSRWTCGNRFPPGPRLAQEKYRENNSEQYTRSDRVKVSVHETFQMSYSHDR